MSNKESTFWDHLEVLRWSILRIVIVLLLFFAAAFAIMPYLFDSVVLAPSKSNFFLYSTTGITAPATEIININVATQFLTHVSTSFWMAFIATFPYLVFELWHFISPALYRDERKSVSFAFLSGTAMFYIGCAVGYFVVFPITFTFLANYNLSSTIANSVSLDSYMSTFLMLIFIMGILFELPLLIKLLSNIGIVNKRQLKEYRRHAVVTLLIIAAIITPTGDPFTLMVVALPLYALYELGILMAKNRYNE